MWKCSGCTLTCCWLCHFSPAARLCNCRVLSWHKNSLMCLTLFVQGRKKCNYHIETLTTNTYTFCLSKDSTVYKDATFIYWTYLLLWCRVSVCSLNASSFRITALVGLPPKSRYFNEHRIKCTLNFLLVSNSAHTSLHTVRLTRSSAGTRRKTHFWMVVLWLITINPSQHLSEKLLFIARREWFKACH